MPTASIIITSHNRPQLLLRAIESAKEAGSNVEVVVVDDASTDETSEVCRHAHDIRYVRVERNQRVAGARNIGILASRGDYLTFLDDDDMRLPGSLDLQVEALLHAPHVGLVYGQALVADQNGHVTGECNPKRYPQGDVFWELMAQNFIPCGTAVFRRSCLFRAGLLDQSVPGIDDWDLWVRLAALYDVMALEKPVLIWRRPTPVSDQGTSRADEIGAMSTRLLQLKWLGLARARRAPAHLRSEARRRFSKNMARHLALESARAIKYGHLRRAQQNALTALRLHPWESVRLAANSSTLRYLYDRAKGNPYRAGIGAHFMRGQTDESKQ